MGSFISRNGLVALFCLGVMMFGISSLVGTDGEDGLLMKAAKDFTGGSEADESGSEEAQPAPVAAPAPAPPAPAQTTSNSEFYDDAELIDPASGFNPSPDGDPSPQSSTRTDEAMILPSPPPSAAPAQQDSGGEPAAGMLVGNGNPVILDGDDEHDE